MAKCLMFLMNDIRIGERARQRWVRETSRNINNWKTLINPCARQSVVNKNGRNSKRSILIEVARRT